MLGLSENKAIDKRDKRHNPKACDNRPSLGFHHLDVWLGSSMVYK